MSDSEDYWQLLPLTGFETLSGVKILGRHGEGIQANFSFKSIEFDRFKTQIA